MTFVGALAQVSDFATVEQRLSDIERLLRRDDGSWHETPPPGLVVIDSDAYRSMPAMVDLYRAAVALSRGRPGRHRPARPRGTGPDTWRTTTWSGPRQVRWRAWRPGRAGTWRAPTPRTPRPWRGWPASASSPTSWAARVTLGDIRQTQGRLGDALDWYRQRPRAGGAGSGRGAAAGDGRHARRDGRRAARARRPGRSRGAPRRRARRWGSTCGCRRTPTGRGSSPPGCARSRATSTARSSLLDEADRVYNGDYSPNVRPVPAVRARLRIRRGELGEADAWAADRGLSSGDELSYLREYEHVTLARLLLARSQVRGDDAARREAHGLIGAAAGRSRVRRSHGAPSSSSWCCSRWRTTPAATYRPLSTRSVAP